ncbi:MAG: 50S ribosomal protein L9 [Amoebophilaceae bacterium]|jgi:large subunit ribosomal protein L9|nr:50S ribosomal protein L9 [Amoebophilaceae bacterium]
MEIILKQDLQPLGLKNSMVTVKPGYGRNYLIPRGLAVVANVANRKIALENARQIAHKVAKLKEEAEALAIRLGQLTVEVTAKAGEGGKIFGSITPSQLVDALKAQRIFVDRKDIIFSKPIKELGVHEAVITLHRDVVHTLSFRVLSV